MFFFLLLLLLLRTSAAVEGQARRGVKLLDEEL